MKAFLHIAISCSLALSSLTSQGMQFCVPQPTVFHYEGGQSITWGEVCTEVKGFDEKDLIPQIPDPPIIELPTNPDIILPGLQGPDTSALDELIKGISDFRLDPASYEEQLISQVEKLYDLKKISPARVKSLPEHLPTIEIIKMIFKHRPIQNDSIRDQEILYEVIQQVQKKEKKIYDDYLNKVDQLVAKHVQQQKVDFQAIQQNANHFAALTIPENIELAPTKPAPNPLSEEERLAANFPELYELQKSFNQSRPESPQGRKGKALGKEFIKTSQLSYERGDQDTGDAFKTYAKAMWDLVASADTLDFAARVTPGVGLGIDLYEAFSGENYRTGEILTPVERGFAVFGVITGGYGSKIKIGLSALKTLKPAIGLGLDHAGQIIGAVGNIGLKHSDEIRSFVKGLKEVVGTSSKKLIDITKRSKILADNTLFSPQWRMDQRVKVLDAAYTLGLKTKEKLSKFSKLLTRTRLGNKAGIIDDDLSKVSVAVRSFKNDWKWMLQSPDEIVGAGNSILKPTQDFINPRIVDDKISALKSGQRVEPIEVLENSSGKYIIDGHHRYMASKITGIDVPVFTRKGELRGLPDWSLIEFAEFVPE
ncbi:MAG: ParB N-terminal domain-containing protein [Bdellovibrionales bacterium]|nr:ParB N-terminal domain-containing protein [Bdellovibrionales bacterium]